MLAHPLSALALVLLSLPAAAHGTVQLVLTGQIKSEAGGCVDVEIGVRTSEGVESPLVALHVFLAQHTSASDVAALLTRRLEVAKIGCVAPPSWMEREKATLFIENVSTFSVRVSGGLLATVGLPECIPAAVGVLPPLAKPDKGSLAFHGTTWDARMRERRSVDFEITLDKDMNATAAGEALVTACGKARWLSDKPSHETWRPLASLEGVELTGVNFVLDSRLSDWGLALKLP